MHMPGWLIWAIVAVLLAVGEILTPGLFFLGPVALAAVAAGIVALAGLGAAVQLIVFIAGSVGSVLLLRPLARRHLHMPAALRTGTAALEGTKAVVVQRVDANGGRIRIGGEEWSARAYMDDGVFEPGMRVEVVKIEGATALIYE
jgi:membrane protein implicated in regulation of membrane protease activity